MILLNACKSRRTKAVLEDIKPELQNILLMLVVMVLLFNCALAQH